MILGTVPFILKKPWIGIMVWLWISVMNPHRFAFGFAYSFPFAAIIAVTTAASMLRYWDQVKFPVNALTVLLIVLPFWMTVSTIFSIGDEDIFGRWKAIMKVYVFVLVTASLLNSRRHVDCMIWVLVVSVGFYGVKGGLFTILTGGGSRVHGPPGGGFMSDNNAISVALVMTIPLMNYLRIIVEKRWMKLALLGSMGLSAMAILGSQSRGAFLAVAMMGLFFWVKSSSKFISGLVLAALVPLAIGFMPESWTARMKSIETYEADASAMGRINAWTMAFNLANDRPLVGGGFEIYNAKIFGKYAPDPTDIHAAHSIYFQILGEHGYVGLVLFLSIGVVGWQTARRIIKTSGADPNLAWAGELAKAIQISLIGYAVGGAFVNIAYWENPYYEIVGLMVVEAVLLKELASRRKVTTQGFQPELRRV